MYQNDIDAFSIVFFQMMGTYHQHHSNHLRPTICQCNENFNDGEYFEKSSVQNI